MSQKMETRCVHGGNHRFPDSRDSISMPIYQTATFTHPDLGHSPDRFYYTRLTNPTRNHLEETVSSLEGARYTPNSTFFTITKFCISPNRIISISLRSHELHIAIHASLLASKRYRDARVSFSYMRYHYIS